MCSPEYFKMNLYDDYIILYSSPSIIFPSGSTRQYTYIILMSKANEGNELLSATNVCCKSEFEW